MLKLKNRAVRLAALALLALSAFSTSFIFTQADIDLASFDENPPVEVAGPAGTGGGGGHTGG